MKKKTGKFYDIMTTEGSNEATIFLYGYIGEEWEWNGMEYEKTGVTDIDFVKELDRLAAQYSVINIRINSFGGEIFHGMAIVNAMQRCTSEIHTYIDGLAASMAGAIWLAGKHRHMAKNALLMLHAGSNICWGNGKDMREMADILDQFTKTLVLGIAESTGQPAEEINTKYFADYKDHWLTHDEVSAESWITDTEEYAAASDTSAAELKAMSYHQLVAHFKEKESPKGQSIMQQVKAALAELRDSIIPPSTQPVIQSPTNIQDMTLEDFQKSLTDGTLKLEDVQAHLLSIATPATPPTTTANAADTVVEDPRIAALEKTVSALQAQVTAFGTAAGAGKSQPTPPATDHATGDGAPNPLQDFNATIAASASAEANPFGRKGGA